MIRLVIADDQAVVRAGLSVILGAEEDIEVVGEAADGAEAITLAREPRPDVVCMDLRMSEGDGLTATRQIVSERQDSAPAVLVVTTFDMDADVFGALEAGADGFILKDCEPEELVDAVRRLASGYGLPALDPAALPGTPTTPTFIYLYLHGWNDYFFQTHLAREISRLGGAFYALDLRRYGRSWRQGQMLGWCTSLAEYDEDLGRALSAIRADQGWEATSPPVE